jgi:hypothetical protein
MNTPLNDPFGPKAGPFAAARAGLCFALLCLALSAVIALGPWRDAGREGLARGGAVLSLWDVEAVYPARQPAPEAPPEVPKAVHFFPAPY